MTEKKIIGIRAEERVAQFLHDTSFTILARNYFCKQGEIDIIAQAHDIIIFVEVKMRTHPLFDVTYVITRQKQRNIIKTAQHFLIKEGLYQKAAHRFDVAIVHGTDYQICYIPNAFHVEE